MRKLSVRAGVALVALAIVTIRITPALAHEHREVDGIGTTVGWVEEPAFAGFRNAVQFVAAKPGTTTPSHTGDDNHVDQTPVDGAELKVEVMFGDRNSTKKTDPLDLRPAFGNPGEYRAFLVPTRSGTYTLHIFGTLDGKEFDQFYTSGEETFNDIQATGDLEFPTNDPSRDQLGSRIERIDSRVASATDDTLIARNLAIGGLALGALALIVALGTLLLKRR